MTRRTFAAFVSALFAKVPREWTILAAGDSITAGGDTFRNYRAPLAKLLADAGILVRFLGSQHTAGEPEELRHEGYGGKTVEFLAERFEGLYRANPADLVLLHAGHNHFAEEQPIPGILKATAQIIATARAVNPRVVVLLAAVIPAGKLPKYEYIPELNRELAILASRLNTTARPVILVDQAAGFDWHTDTIDDHVHPNAAGAEKMAAKWFQAIAAASAPVTELFVSPTGRDSNPGTLTKPFRTLQHAQTAARSALARGPVTVYLRDGIHYLDAPLVLTPLDSGTAWKAWKDEKPIISGGVRLRLQWRPYRDGIWQAQVPPSLETDQLFVNGERQHLARYPNFDPSVRHFNGYAADAFSPERAARWMDPRGGFIHAMHRHEWGDFHYVITGKDANNQVTFEGGWQNNRRLGMHPTYRMVENIFEELDAPGEWFHDRKAHTLYFYPPAGVDLKTATVEAVRLRSLIEVRGSAAKPVRNVRIEGLAFRHAARTFMDNREPLLRSDWTIYRGGAILFEGVEDSAIENCSIDQVGGNAIFVSRYNRRITIRGCEITRAGANAIAFVGDPGAVRSPLFEYAERQSLAAIDRTPGPKTPDYPADSLVEDCLIHGSGRFEKQTAGVEISMSQSITVRHASIYEVPRAGINIGDGTWGGHVIEFCDVFDTVLETGDHGAFNSWGRDRYWLLSDVDMNTATAADLSRLDAVEPVVLHNNRWRCDHGWDIDLDDGSSNYEIRDNLCLNGGLKNREGFFRTVENNVIVNNSFHPHVWFHGSGDVFRRNIVALAYQPIRVDRPWGREVDFNLLHAPGAAGQAAATILARQSGRDAHSVIGDAQFVDAAKGDYRVKPGSPALALGFRNFPMDEFGVASPRLKAIARKPANAATASATLGSSRDGRVSHWMGARVRNVVGLGEVSAAGLPGETGVMILEVPAGSAAAEAGLKANDVILRLDKKAIASVEDLPSAVAPQQVITVVRDQQELRLR